MSAIDNRVIATGRVETRPAVEFIARDGIRVMHSLHVTQGTVGGADFSGWVRAVSSGKLAETIVAGVRPGDRVAVEGALRQQRWVDSKGTRRSARELHVDRMEILGLATCERTDSSRAGSNRAEGEQKMFFNHQNSNRIMNNTHSYFRNLLDSTDRIDVWVSERGHANLDSLPLRYGIRFERGTVLHLENVRDLGPDGEHDDRHHVEADFQINGHGSLSGHFVLGQPRPGLKPYLVTVWRHDVDTEIGLSVLMRSLREKHKLTSAGWIDLHPAYVSGELRTTADLIDLLAERKAEQKAELNGISLRTLEEEKAKAERTARELLASYEKVTRRAEHHRNVALEAIGHVERLTDENVALERKNAVTEAERDEAEAARQQEAADRYEYEVELARLREENARRQESERRSAQRQGQQVAISAPDTLVDVIERYPHYGSSCTKLVLADGTCWYMKTSTFDPDGSVTRKARSLIGRRVRVTSWDPVREPGKWSSRHYFRNIYEVA